jgi:Bacterial SH3 domain
VRSVLLPAALGACVLAAAQTPPAPVAHSPLVWDVREGTHPKLGPIRVAVPSESIVTPVGKEKILSLVFFSCEKARGRIAVELANAAESDARSGLYPKQMPRMFCNPRSTAPRVELATTWFVSEIGDAMARGFAPADLRRCASIDVVQDLALPRGWAADVQHIEIEVIPYKRELESVLAACAEPQVQAEATKAQDAKGSAASGTPAPSAPAVAPPAKPAPAIAATKPQPAPAAPPTSRPMPPPPAELPWKNARILATGGRTNVRARPSIDSPIVTQLDPGALVLVQATDTGWWKAKPRTGTGFSGYIRQDRLSFQ